MESCLSAFSLLWSDDREVVGHKVSRVCSQKIISFIVFSEFVPVSDFLQPKTCRVFKCFVGIKTLEMRYSMANSWKEAGDIAAVGQTWSFRILRVLRSRDKKTLGKKWCWCVTKAEKQPTSTSQMR